MYPPVLSVMVSVCASVSASASVGVGFGVGAGVSVSAGVGDLRMSVMVMHCALTFLLAAILWVDYSS